MLPSYKKIKNIAELPTTETNKKDETERSRNPNWRQFRPELHKKTFFKGATSLTMGVETSLCLKDETARDLVRASFNAIGHAIPE